MYASSLFYFLVNVKGYFAGHTDMPYLDNILVTDNGLMDKKCRAALWEDKRRDDALPQEIKGDHLSR